MLDLKSVSIAMAVLALGLVSAGRSHGQVTLEQAQGECHSAAGQQTGYNPNAATTAPPSGGGRARGAAAGAMAGAAKGRAKSNQYENVPDDVSDEYTKNQMQDAAKMGAAAGAAKQRQGRRQAAAAGKKDAASADAYNKAYASCMTAKGFPGQ